jgi:hypothetical protein
MRSISAYALLLAWCALPGQVLHASTPESCTTSCAEKRDQCKVKACTKAGGHTQLHQGACYNLPMANKQAYASAVTQCTAKLQACSNSCR